MEAGAARREITPPLAVGLLMSTVERRWQPFDRIRKPLYARALVLFEGATKAAVVSLDLLGIVGRTVGGYRRFVDAVARAAGPDWRPSEIVLTATHTHTAPETLGATALGRTPDYQEWMNRVAAQAGAAIGDATALARPCDVTRARGAAPGHGIHRRIRTAQGLLLSHPPVPEEIVLSREGPTDDTVGVVAFQDLSGTTLALLVNATCHPVHEMCLPQVSPDFPGALCDRLEAEVGGTTLFLNGAAGNINPPAVSDGPEAADRHGERLAQVAQEALSMARPVLETALALRRTTLALPARRSDGSLARRPLRIEITLLRLGDSALVFLPGEPFVETGLAIKAASGFAFTAVVGYAGEWIGYIPTDVAFAEGGYETGPGTWSRLLPGAEARVRSAAIALLNAP